MDEKTFRLFSEAQTFLYEATGKRYGQDLEVRFTLNKAEEKEASKQEGLLCTYAPG